MCVFYTLYHICELICIYPYTSISNTYTRLSIGKLNDCEVYYFASFCFCFCFCAAKKFRFPSLTLSCRKVSVTYHMQSFKHIHAHTHYICSFTCICMGYCISCCGKLKLKFVKETEIEIEIFTQAESLLISGK